MVNWTDTVFNNTGAILLQTMLYIAQMKKSPPMKTADITLIDNVMDPFFQNETMKCYGAYGCYSISAPWKDNGRPVNNFPDPLDKIQPAFCLYTRYNPDTCQQLNYANTTSIYRSFFIPFHKTFFVIHGFLETGDRPWIKNITHSLLAKEDANVVAVDWGKGSLPPYTQAVANIRFVGRVAAMLIYALTVTTGLNTQNVHLIGHSLGAHLSGYIGNTLSDRFGLQIGRITGLDPAQPHFSLTDPVVRLDTSDASYVDIIHSHALPFMTGGLGYEEPLGHYDFYPNGGNNQPGCNKGMMGFIKNENQSAFHGMKKFLACDHVRSHEYFLESINGSRCQFLSVECESYKKFLSGECFPCRTEQDQNGTFCAYLGFDSIKTWNKQKNIENRSLVSFYTITGSEPPFCVALYRITLKISNSTESITHKGEVGQFSISLTGTLGKTNLTKLLDDRYFEPGLSYQTVIGAYNVGQILYGNIFWMHHATVNILTWRFDPVIYVGSVVVETFTGNQRTTLCPFSSEILGSQNNLKLVPCAN